MFFCWSWASATAGIFRPSLCKNSPQNRTCMHGNQIYCNDVTHVYRLFFNTFLSFARLKRVIRVYSHLLYAHTCLRQFMPNANASGKNHWRFISMASRLHSATLYLFTRYSEWLIWYLWMSDIFVLWPLGIENRLPLSNKFLCIIKQKYKIVIDQSTVTDFM